MDLCTKSTDIYWNRIVDLYVDREQDCSLYINDGNTFKLLIVKSGVLHIKEEEKIRYIVAPAIILLSNQDHLEIVHKDKLKSLTVYFKPTVIHDHFTYDRLYTEDYENMSGSTLFQDYSLIKTFYPDKNLLAKIYHLTTSALVTILNLVEHMEQELIIQKDGFWPCRSRSYFMELLYYINYSCIEQYKMQTEHAFIDPVIGQIIQYLHEHIGEEITLTELTRQFHMNRNQLNSLFTEQTSLTCLTYLLHIRMDLAKIMLEETELPINEIGERVGYLDTNYFTKVFKKHTSMTPSAYRKKLAH